MKADQERVAKLLNDTVTLLCKNGLIYRNNLTVQGLLGITLDKKEVFIVHINESIGASSTAADVCQKQKQTPPVGSNVVDLTKVADTPVMTTQQQNYRYHNPVPAPVPTSTRKQRPQTINPAMLFQRNELMQQVQQRLRMNSMVAPGLCPSSMPIMPMPANFQARQQMRPSPHRHRQVTMPKRPCIPQHPSQMPISVDEDDVVIIGTGREEPHPSPRKNQNARIGRSPQPLKNYRLPSNESHPIVIPQDNNSFHDISPGAGASFAARIQNLEGLPPGFGEPKKFVGEIVIEPTTSGDIDISNLVGIGGNSARSNDDEPASDRVGEAEKPAEPERAVDANPQDGITVYLDVAEDGVQNDLKPCCRGSDGGSGGPAKEVNTTADAEPMDDETLNLESVGLHMLTDGDDEEIQPTMALSQCKMPACQAVCSDQSQLATHYVLEHSQELDLSIKDTSGITIATQNQPEICPGTSQSETRLHLEPPPHDPGHSAMGPEDGRTQHADDLRPRFGTEADESSFVIPQADDTSLQYQAMDTNDIPDSLYEDNLGQESTLHHIKSLGSDPVHEHEGKLPGVEEGDSSSPTLSVEKSQVPDGTMREDQDLPDDKMGEV